MAAKKKDDSSKTKKNQDETPLLLDIAVIDLGGKDVLSVISTLLGKALTPKEHKPAKAETEEEFLKEVAKNPAAAQQYAFSVEHCKDCEKAVLEELKKFGINDHLEATIRSNRYAMKIRRLAGTNPVISRMDRNTDLMKDLAGRIYRALEINLVEKQFEEKDQTEVPDATNINNGLFTITPNEPANKDEFLDQIGNNDNTIARYGKSIEDSDARKEEVLAELEKFGIRGHLDSPEKIIERCESIHPMHSDEKAHILKHMPNCQPCRITFTLICEFEERKQMKKTNKKA